MNEPPTPAFALQMPCTTNVIESPQSGVQKRTYNVTRWRTGDIVEPWVASAWLLTEQHFRTNDYPIRRYCEAIPSAISGSQCKPSNSNDQQRFGCAQVSLDRLPANSSPAMNENSGGDPSRPPTRIVDERSSQLDADRMKRSRWYRRCPRFPFREPAPLPHSEPYLSSRDYRRRFR